ncbi:MAG: hypothetical protein HYV20_15680 [Gemmatimonadetes bacterium]|nr:hypothetical protein [Gemmatimonadota bacterium]
MRPVDLDRVRDLLGQVADARRRLAELGRLPEEQFLADFRNVGTAKYLAVVTCTRRWTTGGYMCSCGRTLVT